MLKDVAQVELAHDQLSSDYGFRRAPCIIAIANNRSKLKGRIGTEERNMPTEIRLWQRIGSLGSLVRRSEASGRNESSSKRYSPVTGDGVAPVFCRVDHEATFSAPTLFCDLLFHQPFAVLRILECFRERSVSFSLGLDVVPSSKPAYLKLVLKLRNTLVAIYACVQ